METLGKLFSSDALVKIMRLFLMHKDEAFEMKDIVSRSRVKSDSARREVAILKSIGFLRDKVFFKEIEKLPKISKSSKNRKRSGGEEPIFIKRKCKGFVLDVRFPYLKPLQALLIDNETVKKDELALRFRKVGKIRLLIVSGVLTQVEDSRIDFFIVGDNLKHKILDEEIKKLEAEIGSELRYVVFDTEEFKYRLSMYDKLICDVLEFPHEKVIQNISINLEKFGHN